MDNASVCDAMARVMAKFLNQKYEIEFKPENSRICCFAHILNLIVQTFLYGLGEAEDPDNIDYYHVHKHEAIHCTAEDLEEGFEEAMEENGNDEAEELEALIDDLVIDLNPQSLDGANMNPSVDINGQDAAP